MLPDVVVQISGPSQPRGLPAPAAWSEFAVGVTQRGSVTRPLLLQSMQDYASLFGARTTASSLAYDSADTFFGEGGTKLWLSRIVGAGAVQASLNLMDGTSAVSLVVKAGCKGDSDPGTWANGAAGGLQVAVLTPASGGFQLQVFLGGQLVETSPIFQTQADAVGWASGVNAALYSNYLQISLGVSTSIPIAAAAASLTGGTDGSAVASSDHQAALDRITSDYGAGDIADFGATTSALQLQVIAHAVANRRFAKLDAADTSSDTTIETAAAALYAAPNNGRRFFAMFAPWEIVPGLTAFTTRTVPPSARALAQAQKVVALGNPNQAAAGRYGVAQYATDLSQPAWTDTQRQALNNAGVTVSRRRFGGRIVTYGFRTGADQVNDRDWSIAPNVRTVLWYAGQAAIVGDAHFADQLDGFGHSLADFRKDLMGPANDLLAVGALFPDPGGGPETAFYVDTGPAVNTPQTEAQGLEKANVKLRTSAAGEGVVISVVKVPITQQL